MPEQIALHTSDGHVLNAYVAIPAGKTQAGMVVLQEIFGVNAHIRSVADRYAQAGYVAIAPALFDRAETGVELNYDTDSVRKGMEIRERIPIEGTMADIEAALGYLRDQGLAKAGVVGFCWGGSLAWFANTRLHPDATVSYYGGSIAQHLNEKASCPAMFHFGLLDKHIPQSDVDAIRAAHPEFPVYTYEADHGFNCDARSSYNAEAAVLARQRTLAFFEAALQRP